ncbi:MAG TPA: ABC transporter permease [Bacilli bacterium]|nr:ABC transporter permease [Bacilli bacterium]
MKNLWVIIKKELRRIFTDKRMLASLILPGLLIFIVYSVMGDVMTPTKDNYLIHVENEPEVISDIIELAFDEQELSVTYMTYDEPVDFENLVKEGKLHLHVKFDSDFLTKVNNGEFPEVTFTYDNANQQSAIIHSLYYNVVSSLLRNFNYISNDLMTDESLTVEVISGLVPFLLITFLFAGSMAVAPESIAGEKERGTIANLLITPVKRQDIALGKIIALSIAAFVSATSSFLGLMLSFPKLVGGGLEMDLSIYNAGTILAVFSVLLVTVLLFIVLISLISAFSKSIKEATSYAGPLMLITMIPGILSMMGKASTSSSLYLIPVFNSVNTMISLFSNELNIVNFLITIGSNLILVIIGVYLLAKMFNSEKMMFRR